MLGPGAGLALCAALSLLQTGLGEEPAACNFTVTESGVSSRAASLRWRTWGPPCNFSLIYSNDTSGFKRCYPVRIDNTTYECNPKDLQAGTAYTFRIVPLDGEERAVVLQTDPLPPARFEISKEKTTSTNLHVGWTPSSGRVTWYEVQLFDGHQKVQEAQIQESTSWNEYAFSNLTAGSKYNIAITAVSGNKRSSTVHINGSTVPSPVKDIDISAKTNSLLISWSHGPGNVERYQLILMDKGILVHNVVVDKYTTSYTFLGLTSGHLYNLTIVTEAAGLQNQRWKLARTTPMEVSALKVTNDDTLTSLKVKWQRPPGDVDSYNITLSHQGTTQESITLAPQVTETQFKGLTPGRLYQVTISCVSGELSAQKMAVGRTVPEKVGNLEANSNGSLRSLVVSWSPPAGDWEQYRILLFNDSLMLLNITVGKEETHYVIDDIGLVPGRQYEVEVIVESGNLKNSKRCQGRTVPMAVLQLRVKHANETSLGIMWQTPVAEWEKYIISLADRNLLLIHKSLPKDAKEFTFTDLVPGRKYIATVTSISGDLKNSSSTKGRTVPAQVTGLHVANQRTTSSLFTNWTQAVGDTEFYQVLLIHENVVIKNESVSSETSTYSFHNLKSGSLYSVVVTTVSGGISSRQVVVEGRTVPSSVSGVTVNNSGRNDYLSISWLPAPGDVDNYVVTLSHGGKVVQSLITGVVTMPQYLKKRFGGQRIQVYMSVLSLILYIFTKISTDIFSGALFIQMALGWNLYLSTVVLLVVTAIYTIAGGLTAVIYTDALQTVIMVGGALVLMFLGFKEVGWYPGLEQRYRLAIPNATVPNTSCHLPRPDAFHMLRDPVSGDIPWPGLIFGLTVLATWCWCTDQVIVQRSLSAKSLSHAKGGSVLGGYLKILPMFFIVMPGMISRALYPDEVGCVDPDVCQRVCGARVGCSNIAYPKLVIALMPIGLRGLMIAVIMAALMSSLTSIFNSSSTLFAIDVWQRFRKKATEQELMVVGRVFVVCLVAISILWIPIIQSSNSGQLFDYIQSVTSYLAPPVTALFLLAIFCKRVTEPGAFWGLMFGLVVGLLRMILEFSYPAPACGEVDQRPAVLKDFHYLYFALLLCGLTAIIMVAISLCTNPIPEEELARLTWWTRNRPRTELEKEAHGDTPGTSEMEMPPDMHPAGGGGTQNPRQGPEQQGAPRRSWGKLLWGWFCGLSGAQEPALSPAEKAALELKLTSIEEEPLWRRVCDINAVLLLAINVFLWGYFA